MTEVKAFNADGTPAPRVGELDILHMLNTPSRFKPTDDFVDYITNSDNVWNPERYLESRRCNGVHEGDDYNFKYTYVLGNAYMVGTLGRIGNIKVEVYYQHLQGFQVHLFMDGEKFRHFACVPHKADEVKELLAFYATNGN